MNHHYKRLFNRSLKVWQAVPETARARGKSGWSATQRICRPLMSAIVCRRSLQIGGVALALLMPPALAQTLPSPPHSSGGESANGGAGGGIDADGEGIAGSAGGGGGPGAAGGADGGGSGGSHGNEGDPTGGDGEHGGGLTSGGGGGGHGYLGEDIPAADDIAGGNGGRGNSGGGGGAGGYGAFVTNGGTAEIADSQSLRGGDGGLGSSIDRDNRGRGGDGGAGLYFQGDSLTNAGRLSGGSSGDGNVTWDLDGGDGGAGLIFDGRELINRGTISGGDGGPARQGDGGFGGTGLDFNGTTLVNDDDGTISGGAGGRMEHDEFDGGVGGIGLVFDGSDLTNRGSIFGGEGGAGAGNDGGIGLTFSGGELINQGAISGGDGGRAHLGTGSDGGDGGVGIIVEADGARIVNEGAISGGDGGESGNGVGGAGNVGVIVEADGATVVNAGTISGGSGRGRAAALTLNGGDGTLELRAGYAFQGDVVANGANATLALGDVERFDVEDLGSLYSGFENFVNRSGSGTMLTGYDRAGTDWLVERNSALLVDTDSLRGDVEVENNAVMVFNHDFDGVYTGAVFGEGMAIFGEGIEAGTLLLTGDSSAFSGETTVSGGTLLVGDADGIGRLGGSITVAEGATLGGSGTVGSSGSTTTIADGGILAPGNSIGTLDFGGSLVLSSGSILDFQLGGPGSEDDPASGVSDRIHVAEDLTLDGTLNLSQSGDASVGAAGFGYYRLVTYGGALDGDGLTMEDTPAIDNAGYRLLTDTDGQFIDLFVGALGDDQLQRWQGGDGAWTVSGETWRNIDSDGMAGDMDVAWAGNTAIFDDAPGGTVVVEGTQGFAGLQFRHGDYVLEGSGQLQTDPDGSEIRVLAERAGVATAITGTGGVGITGGGTLILSGNNRYEGGTTLAGGTTLSVSDDTNLGHADGALTFNGGTLTTTDSFDSARDVVLSGNGRFGVADDTALGLSGNIAGSGDLRLVGNGTLELTGTNDYGNTVVEAGTLLGNVEAISGDIANAGTVVFGQTRSGSFAGDIAGLNGTDGDMILRGGGSLTLGGFSSLDWAVEDGTLISASDRFTGDLDVAAGASFIFDQDYDGAYAGAFSGSGTLDFTGGGLVELTGDSSGFAGLTEVTDTTLVVNDTLSGSAMIGMDGVLAGDGTIGSGTGSMVTLASGATLAPGNSIGELTVDGDLTFEAGSHYEVEVDPTSGDSDHTHVTGTAFLEGSVVHIGLGESDDYAPESRYRILSAEGGLDGEFGEVTSAFTFLDAALMYDTESDLHGVDLTLERNGIDFADVAGTRNQRATAGGIDSLAAGHAVYDVIVTHAGSEAELREAYDRLSGELHASTHGALIEDSRLVRQAANDRLRAADGAATVPMVIGDNPATDPTATPSTAWVRAIGNWGSNAGDGNAASLNRDTFGVAAGVDTQVSERVRAGVLTGYTRGDISIGGGRGSADVDSAHFGLYAGVRLDDDESRGELSLRGGAFYGYHEVDSQRHVQVGTLGERLEDERSAHTLHAYGELAYRVDAGPATLEPFVNLAHVHQRTSSSEENGGNTALHSDSQTSDTSFATLGVRPSVEVNIGDADATLYGSVGWRHAFGDNTRGLDQRFVGGDAFSIAGTPIAENSGVVEAGVSVALNERTLLDLAYGGQYGDGMEDHGARATFEWRF
ncbi:autotransporter domain-containing protein [Halomonas sp. MCCC 1A11036]|uniref:Autotransporter domain-containing protein n=1 Tax=Billgrantia zhangzhouensis TaxID=2733481 RepID=A0ABS9ADS1_9GAMM|nr:autotransporter domain-containing protein [Halomonas zhangzhouensis]MCE8019868.1 autotransporter domain-containing protein [Halomonas zhangzhouensis]